MTRIAFDFDMTIADTSESVKECLKSAISECNHNYRDDLDEIYRSIRGLSLEEQIRNVIVSQEDSFDMEPIVSKYLHIYPTVGVQNTRIFDGVATLFDWLGQRDVLIDIISAKRSYNLSLSIDFLGIKPNSFVGSMTSADKIAYLNRVKCSAYVGDTLGDVKIAKEAGVLSLIINSVNEDIDDWKTKPFKSFTTFKEFSQWLMSSGNLAVLEARRRST